MKKIDFGYNNDSRLNASFEGIYPPYTGQFIDLIKCEGVDMLVTRIIAPYKPEMDGHIDVCEIAQNFYSDGSYATYSSQDKSAMCRKIEILLNNSSVKSKMDEGIKLVDILRNAGIPVTKSSCHQVTTDYENIPGLVTSVRPELFEALKQSIMHNHSSMFDMYNEIQRLRDQQAKINESKHV